MRPPREEPTVAIGATIVALVAVLAPPAVAQDPMTQTVALDPAVLAAQQTVEAVRSVHATLLAALDQAAGAFEAAQAQTLVLDVELADAEGDVDGAEVQVEDARTALAAQIRRTYMHPGAEVIALSEAVLSAEDAPSAVHQGALYGQLVTRRAQALEDAVRAGQHVYASASSTQDVRMGLDAAQRDLQAQADALQQAVEAAAAELTTAEGDLSQLEQEVRERLEAQLRAAEAAAAEAAAAAAAAGIVIASAPPAWAVSAQFTNGLACPVGQPNGFIDSWGFPRSGGRTHKGVDMFAAYGMPLFAAADGVISRVGHNALGGLYVDLIDVWGNRYYYAHLSAAYAYPGRPVRAGDIIGAVGNSGNARTTPPHLHWQFHPGSGGPVNPYPLAAALCRGPLPPAPAPQ